jgi:hypothetical protein
MNLTKTNRLFIYGVTLLAVAIIAALASIYLPQLNELLSDGSGYKPL